MKFLGVAVGIGFPEGKTGDDPMPISLPLPGKHGFAVHRAQRILDLPLNGRQATQLIQLAGAAVYDVRPQGRIFLEAKTFTVPSR